MKIHDQTIKELIKTRVKTPADLAMVKRKIAKKYKSPCPSNIELLKAYHKLVKNKRIKPSKVLENLLRTRPIRSLSGIVNVSVLTKPYPCPGECIYCPNQNGVPKSYLDNEPAVMRAILNQYDPAKQIQMRLSALENAGHPTDKIELRIIGGTWSYYPKRYQNWFITRCFAACNAKLHETPKESLRLPTGQAERKTTRKIKFLSHEQKLNEKAKHRIVGLSIETRPDYITVSEIKRLRKLGVTMVELGVQSIYDDVLKLNKRGHKVKETILATKLLKDAGFKVLYQVMPNLPGSNLKRDEKMFRELFSNPDFQPDLLKIYPTAILKEAPLYDWWKKGKYRPYKDKELINLVKSIKRGIPYYVRIQRITRDIPSQSVVAGPAKISNLRQVLAALAKKEGWKCKCIRCREVRGNYRPKEKLYLFRENYDASEGREIFLSFEAIEADRRRLSTPINTERKLYALLRLRIPSQIISQCNEVRPRYILPVLENAAIIREVHTYGQLHPLNYTGRTRVISPQHKGLGKKLIKEAEKIVYTEFDRSAKKEFDLNKVVVISGIGVRDYYRKMGYKLKDTYMIKNV